MPRCVTSGQRPWRGAVRAGAVRGDAATAGAAAAADSKSQMLLQSITITSRNALQLPGCAGQSADVHCLGGAV